MIDVIVPTYGRPHVLERVAANIHEATVTEHRVVFVVERDDEASQEAAAALGEKVVTNLLTHNYTGAMNTAVALSPADYWFAGADDLNFHPGWDEACLSLMDGWTMVVGTNDLLNRFVLEGLHATHYLVDREYVATFGGTVDLGAGVAYFTGTHHDYSDTEFVGVAKARCRFRPCLEAVVEHMHWTVGKAPIDATYRHGLQYVDQDRALYLERKKLWDSLVL